MIPPRRTRLELAWGAHEWSAGVRCLLDRRKAETRRHACWRI